LLLEKDLKKSVLERLFLEKVGIQRDDSLKEGF
jgi:hypothetical protein